jgi:hypothetical protein
MRTTRRRLATVPVFLAALTAFAAPRPAAAAAEDYPIKFERPAKVGERFRLTAEANQKMERSVKFGQAEAQKQAQDATITLTGELTVLEVSDKGRVTKTSCKVGRLEVTPAGGRATQPVEAGKTLVAERKGKEKAVTLEGGGELDPALAALLQEVLSVDDPATPDNDEVFGTPDRKKVGDSWDASPTAIRVGAERSGLTLKKDGITGKVTFVGVRKVNGVDAGAFKVEVNAEAQPGSVLPNVPPTIKLVSGTIKDVAERTLPLDPANRSETEASDSTINMEMAGDAPGGDGKITVTVVGTRHKTMRYEPVK